MVSQQWRRRCPVSRFPRSHLSFLIHGSINYQRRSSRAALAEHVLVGPVTTAGLYGPRGTPGKTAPPRSNKSNFDQMPDENRFILKALDYQIALLANLANANLERMCPMEERKVAEPALDPRAISVFIRCPTCGTENCFEDIPTRRVDLALFRGSAHVATCKGCSDEMDTMGAYCGERVGVEIERRPDPEY
jgi:hypothetical protein